MTNGDPDLVSKLKSLEGNNYGSEMALFDTLCEIGVAIPKGYRSGGRNKELAKKEADRYVEYKPLNKINPNYKGKRAVTITQVRDPPKPKEDGRGARGRYTDYLRPLIVRTAMDHQFRGTKAELFDRWGVYDSYREEQIKNGSFKPQRGYSFNPWSIDKGTPPGKFKYCQVISYKERDSLETSLNSLSREGIIEWNKYTRYVPLIKTTELVDSVDRLKSWNEYMEDCNKRLNMVIQLAERENCVLSPDLFQEGLYVLQSTYDSWSQLYNSSNGKELPNEQATKAQEDMYDNYQEYMRQLTMRECSSSKKFCLPEMILNKRDIFIDWTYRRKYNELDKVWKGTLLGWEQVRQELCFKIIDERRAVKYLEQYTPELVFKLGREYIRYMDEHMDKEKVYYPEDFTSDFEGVISPGRHIRKFPLRTSRSACILHQKLKEFFNDI